MKKLTILLLALLGVVVLMSAYIALEGESSHIVEQDPMRGQSIIAVSGVDFDGNTVRIQDELGAYTLVNVWASWCSICMQEHAYLLELSNNLDIDIIGINYRDTASAGKQVLRDRGNPFSKILFDPLGDVAMEFGVVGTPETFLIDESGIILTRFRGALDAAKWDRYFKPLLME
ncbi:DsbE family thiol:disulfide interchange protein [Vibrio ulleungensis]|uniref:DsbE family thiol:disulfide interchange protein n=1 Tax=Vibrio ulleungensis TaxID=2807619 RepID=A0ABS2HEA7_9VIBR|nr:DsbE family thiol:disulfide interchange protein [Vibrio ulleungensis]MBM7035915.1 DsbE family thiol:disulfide interchange protein [Vibrio ulleungensis]